MKGKNFSGGYIKKYDFGRFFESVQAPKNSLWVIFLNPNVFLIHCAVKSVFSILSHGVIKVCYEKTHQGVLFSGVGGVLVTLLEN